MKTNAEAVFNEVKEVLIQQMDSNVAWQSNTQICFEDNAMHTLLVAESEEWSQTLAHETLVFVEHAFVGSQKPYSYSCYVTINNQMYELDMRFVGVDNVKVYWDIYRKKYFAFSHITEEDVPANTASKLADIFEKMMTHLKELSTFRLYFVTGMYTIHNQERLERMKKKEGSL